MLQEKEDPCRCQHPAAVTFRDRLIFNGDSKPTKVHICIKNISMHIMLLSQGLNFIVNNQFKLTLKSLVKTISTLSQMTNFRLFQT